MIVECPRCKSTFQVVDNIEMKSISNFKCSVCEHVWKINIKPQNPKPIVNVNTNTLNTYSYILILNLVILIFGIVALILHKDEIIYSNSF